MLAIVQTEDADAALERLNALGLPAVVRIAASGGFLRQGNVALWAATPPERVPEVMQALRETCHRRTSYIPALPEIPHQAAAFPLEVEIGGATIFLCEVERYEAF